MVPRYGLSRFCRSRNPSLPRYAATPELDQKGVHVLSTYEKTGIQAIERDATALRDDGQVSIATHAASLDAARIAAGDCQVGCDGSPRLVTECGDRVMQTDDEHGIIDSTGDSREPERGIHG